VTVTIDATGLHVQTYEEILEEIIIAISVGLALTAAQTQRLRDTVGGSWNQLVRIEAEREAGLQESLLAVYNTLSLEAEGVPLDRVAALLGVSRRAESYSVVAVEFAGVAATVIPDGTRVQNNTNGSIWLVDGPAVVGLGGTVDGTMTAETVGAVLIAGGATAWTILDVVVGFTGVTTDEQTVVGAATETDAELRARVAVEAYRRGQGPQAAIRAAVSQVTGVTYVGVWESTALAATDTDSNGIPARSINVVVEGGDSDEIAAAIQTSRAGGIRLFGLPGATQVERTILLSNGSPVLVQFNRVDEIEIWINCEITTSTAEDSAPPDVDALVAAILLEAGPALFDIGDDVLPWKLEQRVGDEEIPGIDDVRVELSTDDGATDAYSRAKRSISIRERSTFLAARITVTEV
jgi:uncharacterized phage protein gp47/JayE